MHFSETVMQAVFGGDKPTCLKACGMRALRRGQVSVDGVCGRLRGVVGFQRRNGVGNIRVCGLQAWGSPALRHGGARSAKRRDKWEQTTGKGSLGGMGSERGRSEFPRRCRGWCCLFCWGGQMGLCISQHLVRTRSPSIMTDNNSGAEPRSWDLREKAAIPVEHLPKHPPSDTSESWDGCLSTLSLQKHHFLWVRPCLAQRLQSITMR